MEKEIAKITGNKHSLLNSYFKNSKKKEHPDSLPDIIRYWKKYSELPFTYSGTDWLFDAMSARQKQYGLQNDQYMTPDGIARQIVQLTNNFRTAGNQVLNACCGIGQLTKYLLESQFDVYGYDIDETLVEACSLMYPCATFYSYNFCQENKELAVLSTIKEWDMIVSNAPSSQSNITSFIGWLSTALSNTGKAILLMPDDFEHKKYSKLYTSYIERYKILSKLTVLPETTGTKSHKMQVYIMELTEEYKKERARNLSDQEITIKENSQNVQSTDNKIQIMEMQNTPQIQNVRLDEIVTNPLNPRKKIKEADIRELAQSIKQVGLLQAILLRKKNDRLEIVAGECRYRAFCLNREETIPAVIGEYTDTQVLVLALTENMNRNNLSPLEEAEAFYSLVTQKQYNMEELSLKFGKTENYIRNRLRLHLLIPDFKNMLENDELSLGVSIELSKYSHAVQQDVYETYYKNITSPMSWMNISKKEVADRLVKLYTMNLIDYQFDKEECKQCPYNTDTNTLFDECKGKCTNLECLRNKQHQYTLQMCKLRVEQDQFEVIILPTDRLNPQIEEKLKDEGIAIHTTTTFETLEPPQKPDRNDFKLECDYQDALQTYKLDDLEYNSEINDYENKVSEGKYKRCLHIGGNNPKICYAPLTGNSQVKTVSELEEQVKINYEATKNNIIKASLELIRTGEITSTEFSVLEEEIFLFLLTDHITKKQFPQFGIADPTKDSLSDKDKESILSTITNAQYGFLKRNFILKSIQSLNANRLSVKQQIYLQSFTQQHFPAESETIVKKYLNIYQKNKDKIEKEITKVKKGGIAIEP